MGGTDPSYDQFVVVSFFLVEEACKHVNRGTFVKVETRVTNLVVL